MQRIGLQDFHERFYVGAEGHVPPDSLVASPQLQKLADRSGVITEVPKCSEIHAGGSLQRSPRSPS